MNDIKSPLFFIEEEKKRTEKKRKERKGKEKKRKERGCGKLREIKNEIDRWKRMEARPPSSFQSRSRFLYLSMYLSILKNTG